MSVLLARCGVLLCACMLLSGAARAEELQRLVARAPTAFVENGKPVTLEVVIFKPAGAGPFRTLVFNHGSTGRGDNAALYTRTYASPSIARFFVERGWLVAFPQRRGRGASDGAYDEGFEPGRMYYTCRADISLAGLERAQQDLDAVYDYLKGRPDVDAGRMLVGGVSRGGILSVAHAARRPERFKGVINFVGGWISDSCGNADAINTQTFKRAGTYPGPTLWVYGDGDRFYRVSHSRANFEAFKSAGGAGEFHLYAVPAPADGHAVAQFPDLWRGAMEKYLEKLP